MFEIGDVVRVMTMARTDAIGRIVAICDGRYVVRLLNWQADGYHLDVACRAEELREER